MTFPRQEPLCLVISNENKETAANTIKSMMGSGGMVGNSDSMMGSAGHMMDDPEQLANMPSRAVFQMLTDNCSSCHERYRVEE